MSDSNKLSCGTYIGKLRKENNYTLKELAENLGVSVSFLVMWSGVEESPLIVQRLRSLW